MRPESRNAGEVFLSLENIAKPEDDKASLLRAQHSTAHSSFAHIPM